MNDFLPLAKFTVQAGTRTGTEDFTKNFQSRRVGVGHSRNPPRHRKPGKFCRKFLVNFATAELRWLGGDINRFESLARRGLEKLAQLLPDFRRIHIPHDHEGQVVRDIPALVVAQHIVAREFVVNIQISDHRMPERTFGKNSPQHQLGRLPPRIVKPHRELPANDLLLLHILLLGQGRVLHHIGEDIHRLRGSLGRNVDPIHRAVERGVGIDVSPPVLNLLGNLAGRAFFGSLEEHVLEDVRHSSTHPGTLMNATGAAPGLNAGNRRAAILFDDQCQAVVIGKNLGAGFRQCGNFGGFGR